MKIANNILSSDDPKYRTIKATNGMLQKKVLSVKGGHDYIIAVSDVSLPPKTASPQFSVLGRLSPFRNPQCPSYPGVLATTTYAICLFGN